MMDVWRSTGIRAAAAGPPPPALPPAERGEGRGNRGFVAPIGYPAVPR